jgi:hypothetical protein
MVGINQFMQRNGPLYIFALGCTLVAILIVHIVLPQENLQHPTK